MTRYLGIAILAAGSLGFVSPAASREWSDKTGTYSIEAALLAFDDENVILQREDKELGTIRIEQLSEQDREYLKTKEAEARHEENIGQNQVWTTVNGVKLIGRIVDYAKRDVQIQRRRGRIFVNNTRFENLPKPYQKLMVKVVEYHEDVKLPTQAALQQWLRTLRGAPREYHLEGVVMEMDNGDEYAIPFFVFADPDRQHLEAGWSQWLATVGDHTEQDDHAFRLEASAAAYARNQQRDQQIAMMQLNLQAIQAGITAAWEVTLYPARGTAGPPQWVVVPARDSRQASQVALQQNPGYVVGPVRRVSR